MTTVDPVCWKLLQIVYMEKCACSSQKLSFTFFRGCLFTAVCVALHLMLFDVAFRRLCSSEAMAPQRIMGMKEKMLSSLEYPEN
jgi:hypothetical protein